VVTGRTDKSILQDIFLIRKNERYNIKEDPQEHCGNGHPEKPAVTDVFRCPGIIRDCRGGQIMTDNIEVLAHSSIRIRTGIGTVYIDPFKMTDGPHDAACIFVTHDHYDHFSPEDIQKAAGPACTLIVPENMKEKAQEAAGMVSSIFTVRPGEAYELSGLKFETVPAYNILKPFHPKSAGWVGYILETGGERIYIAGDTDATKEAEAVKCDVALVPCGGTYTMNAKKAAELVNKIRPKAAIPTHYGCIVGKKEDGEEFASGVDGSVRVEMKIKF